MFTVVYEVARARQANLLHEARRRPRRRPAPTASVRRSRRTDGVAVGCATCPAAA